jgi:hypothetical protein
VTFFSVVYLMTFQPCASVSVFSLILDFLINVHKMFCMHAKSFVGDVHVRALCYAIASAN